MEKAKICLAKRGFQNKSWKMVELARLYFGKANKQNIYRAEEKSVTIFYLGSRISIHSFIYPFKSILDVFPFVQIIGNWENGI